MCRKNHLCSELNRCLCPLNSILQVWRATNMVNTLKVLLIARSPMGMSFLAARLTKCACEIHFASSYQEANAFLNSQKYDLVLSEFRLQDGSAYPLADLLLGSNTTLVYSYAVE